MKYTFALCMTLGLTLGMVSVDPATAQSVRNKTERVQDHKQLMQDRRSAFDDRRDLEKLEDLRQRYAEAVDRGDLGVIQSLDSRFMSILGAEQREAGQEMLQGKAEVRQGKKELRSDNREVRRNRRQVAGLKEKADDHRDRRDDRRDLRDDRRDLRVQRQDALNLSSIRDSFGALVGRNDPQALVRKLSLMDSAVELARSELGQNAEEQREDRRELREDRHESREDRRQR